MPPSPSAPPRRCPYLLYFSLSPPPPLTTELFCSPRTNWQAGQRSARGYSGGAVWHLIFCLLFVAPFGHFGTYSAKASGSDLSAQPKNDYSWQFNPPCWQFLKIWVVCGVFSERSYNLLWKIFVTLLNCKRLWKYFRILWENVCLNFKCC